MNTTAHPVAPEEVMAFLDGELSAGDAQAVTAHVDGCAECSALAQHLRSTSLSLSNWSVSAVPAKLEDSVTERAAKTKGNLPIRTGFGTWKQWAIASGGALGVLWLVVAISVPNLRYAGAPKPAEMAFNRRSLEVAGGSLGKLQSNGQPITKQRSAVIHDRNFTGLATLSSSGGAADSNGLFHGVGDRVQDSLSVDGQLNTDQQSKMFSAPMIARTISLSIMVKDFAASRSALDSILARHHGYSAQLNVSTPENAPRSLQASLRIPAPELSLASGDLKTLGRVENESQSGEEVTQEHADLVARLKTSRETEQRFRTILEQRTGNAVEVLQVEEGIARVRGDIERMEAEQKALEHRVDFATVELQLTEEYKAQLNPPAASVSTRLRNAFVAGYRNVAETVLGIVLFFAEYGPALLLWAAIVCPVIFVWRRYRRALAAA